MTDKIKLVLEQLYAIKDDDKFYFMTYGQDWIEQLINPPKEIKKPKEVKKCKSCGLDIESYQLIELNTCVACSTCSA